MKKLALEQGQIIKNYKELCKLLGVKPTKGKGRQYHIQELARYCKFHNEGHKFIVDEVYDIPIAKIDGRKRVNGEKKIDGRQNNGRDIVKSTYDDLMDQLLINMLYEYEFEQDEILETTCDDLSIYNIELFTRDYKDLLTKGYEKFAKQHNMKKGLVLTYRQKLKDVVRKCLETSLNRLQKKNIILWEKKVKFANDNGDYQIASNTLTQKIKEKEQDIYKEMDISYIHRTNPKTNQEFKRKVCRKLDGVRYYWNVYAIKLIDYDIQSVESNKEELI